MEESDIKEGIYYVVEYGRLDPRFDAKLTVIIKVTHIDLKHLHVVGPGIQLSRANFGSNLLIGNITVPLSIIREGKVVDETSYNKAMKIYNMFSLTYTSLIDKLLDEDETNKDNE